MEITLKQCRYFKTVALKGGIAPAAQSIGISQPAVAQAIAKLEDQTGLVLFRRMHARGMQLTAQGIEFLRYADQMLVYADRMKVAVADIAAQRMGTLRLGCFQSIAPFYLSPILREYPRDHPGVVLDVHERLQDELLIALGRNEIDLAILYDLGIDDTRYQIWPLVTTQPYLIVPPDHRLASQKSVSIGEINGENFVLFDAPHSREFFLGLFARFNITPKIAFRSTTIEAVRCHVANGLGISLLSMKPAKNTTYNDGQVVPIKLIEDLPATHIVMAAHIGAPQNFLIGSFASFCQEMFANL